MGDDKRTYADRRELATTDMQERFAIGLAEGLGPTVAARVAGYSAPSVAGARLTQAPAVRAKVLALRKHRIDRLSSLSLRALEEMVRGHTTVLGVKVPISSAVRFNAIKLSLGMAGHTEKPSDDEANPLNAKAVSEMSLDELNAFLAKETSKRADAAKPVLDHETVQSQANPLKDNGKTEPFAGSALLIEGEAIAIFESGANVVTPTPGPADGDPPPGVPRP